MPYNNLVRVAHAGGFNNPALNLNFVPDVAGAEQNALKTRALSMQNQLAGQQLQNYDADRQRLMGQQDIDRNQVAFEFLKKAAPTFGNVQSYLSQRPALINQFGIPEQMLPTMEEIQSHVGTGPGYETVEDSWERWKERFRKTDEDEKPPKYSAPKEGIDENGNPIVYRVGPNGEVDILKGVQPTPKKGMTIYDRETGQPIVTMGGSGEGPDITPKTKANLEEKFLNASNQLARIQEIRKRYKSEYLQAWPRLANAWTSLRSKFGGKIPEKEKTKLSKQTAFLRTTITNANKHIKETTGAQMSEKEAGRILLEVPKAGQSWFDFLWNGDSPIEFESKMDDIEITLKAAQARYLHYKAKGLTLEEIQTIVNADEGEDLDVIKERFKANVR